MAIGVALLGSACASAQQRDGEKPGSLQSSATTDESGLEVIHVQGNVYLIAGAGANIAVQTGPDGMLVVDSGDGGSTDAVIAELVRLGAHSPIRYVLNTSAEADHVSGNERIAAAGVPLGGAGGGGPGGGPMVAAIVGQEDAMLRMISEGQPPAAWPLESFPESKNIFLNGESIVLEHQPAAHSDGDATVFFRRSDVVVAGEIVDITRFPRIDVERGGSIQGTIDALNRLILVVLPPVPLAWVDGGTKVIPARGWVIEQADLVEYRDMVTIVRDVIATMIEDGMSLEEVQAANPTLGYNGRYGSDDGSWTTAQFVAAVYTSLVNGRADQP